MGGGGGGDKKIRFDIPYELSAKQAIYMECQVLFSTRNILED